MDEHDYLDPIAEAVLDRQEVRDWLLKGTHCAEEFMGAKWLHHEQRNRRPKAKKVHYDFWCGKGKKDCMCMIEGSESLQTDALFIFAATSGRKLAVHVEFKGPLEPMKFGQAENYLRRARCWTNPARRPKSVLPHDDWVTVVFCGDAETGWSAYALFDRRIGHDEARAMIPGYPEI